jgi:hypothetical protein
MPLHTRGNRIDNHGNFEYNHRYLDSAASILNIASPVAITHQINGLQRTFIYSTNSNFTPLRQCYDALARDVLQNLITRNEAPENPIGNNILGNCLMFYLTFNNDFYSGLRYISKSLDNEQNQLLQQIDFFRIDIGHTRLLFRNNFQQHQENNLNLLFGLNNLPADELINQYIDIKNDLLNLDLDEHLIRKFCKPFHVISKLYSYFQSANIIVNTINFNLLPNNNNLHAEVNVVNHSLNNPLIPQNNAEIIVLANAIQQQINIEYIGISKLCCARCDLFLTITNIPHRGAHPVVYDIGLTEQITVWLDALFDNQHNLIEVEAEDPENINIRNNQDHDSSFDQVLHEQPINFHTNELEDITLQQFLALPEIPQQEPEEEQEHLPEENLQPNLPPPLEVMDIEAPVDLI